MNTTENNKIIAEFMGWKLGHPDLFELRWGNDWFKGRDKKTNKGYLFFDSDWNWLMEVVEKIEGLRGLEDAEDVLYFVTIELSYCEIKAYNFVIEQEGSDKKEAVYNACVEFIKWYNEQKPKP